MKSGGLQEILSSRRSIRQFRPDPVAEETVRRLLDAACTAPSAHNSQPWRFVVLRDPAARRNLAERMADDYRRQAEAEGRPMEQVRARNERSVARIIQAPLAILACTDRARLPSDSGWRADGELQLLHQSVSAAIQNLLLAAHAEGLGACWLCAPVFCPQVVREALDLPAEWDAQALILLGYPDEKPDPPKRNPLDEITQWR